MSTFSELGLVPEILEAIRTMGYENPTPVQARAIPFLLQQDGDLIALASTGTGKTAAYGLPLIQFIVPEHRYPQALVLAPTRELCVQITGELENFARNIRDIRITAVYGGASITDQIRKIKAGTNIIVATPGRLIDLLGRKVFDLNRIATLVLDEADEMLNLGFQEEIDQILEQTPPGKRTLLFSATMPTEVRNIAKRYMDSPEEITVGKTREGAENIRHVYYLVRASDRYTALKRILDYSPEIFGIIFGRTRIETQEIAEKLMRDGYNADAIHGDLSQQQRDKVMGRFRDRSLQVLVATDVAARGIDVSDITHVIHYNLPDDLENYTHRSGRTARAGKHGVSLSLVTSKEVGKIKRLEKSLNRKFLREAIPTGREVCELKLFVLMEKALSVEVNEAEMEVFMPRIMELFEGMEREEIVKRFAALEFNQFLSYYRNAPDLNPDSVPDHDGTERYISGSEMFISLGKKDGFDRAGLLHYICETTGVTRSSIGRINVKGVYAFFEVEPEAIPVIEAAFSEGIKFQGRKVRVDVSGNKKSSAPRENKGFEGKKKFKKDFPKKDFGKKDKFGPKKKKFRA